MSWFGEEQRERWTGPLRFAASWRGAIGEDDGLSEEVIGEAERRLGARLPEALREWYLIAGRRDDLTRVQNQLLVPTELYIDEGHLVFYSENQGVVRWGIPIERVNEADPLVMIDKEYYVSSGLSKGWFNEGRTLSIFIYQMIVLETVLTSETAHWFPVKVSLYKRVQNHHLLREVKYFWSDDWPGSQTCFFSDNDMLDEAEIIVVFVAFSELFVAGKDQAAFDRARKLFRLK